MCSSEQGKELCISDEIAHIYKSKNGEFWENK
jgi:hypothetical protein